MVITSRQRVTAAFEHKEPDRVPCWCGASTEFWENAKNRLNLDDEGLRIRLGDDFRRVCSRYIGPEFELSDKATSRTPFGIERSGMGYGYAICHPLAQASTRDIKQYHWPDPDWMDISSIRDEAKKHYPQYAILGGDWSPFWHDLSELMGMENMYLTMYSRPELVDLILQHIVDYYFECSRRIFEEAGDLINIFFIGNNFGSKNGPLLGPDMFRRFILSHLARLIDLGHSYDLEVMLHCCGGFAELIPMMIEAGLDGLHAVQPSCRGMDLKELKTSFGKKILFNGAIDSQHILINGTPDYVRAKTREVLKIMMPGGGFVAGASHDSILPETPLENVLAMFDAIREFGTYG